MEDQFTRTRLLLGDSALDILASSRVCVFGLGGVGGHVVEALARSGIGAMDIVDDDVVSASNLNRQIIATVNTIGQEKTEAAAARIAMVNPHCKVVQRKFFYLPQTRDQFDFSQYDYVVDAIDTVTAKLDIAEAAYAAGTPLISSMGMGNKLDPTQIEVADINETSVCKLAKTIRKELRKRGIPRLKCVYSKEPSIKHDEPIQEQSGPHAKRSTPGSVPFVPGAAGLIIASEVVRDLIAIGGADE